MTQLSARVEDQSGLLGRIVPRPRLEGLDLVKEACEAPTARTKDGSSARTYVLADVVAAVAAAALVTAVPGVAPTVVVAVGIAWLVILAASGHYRRHGLGASRSDAVTRVLQTGAKSLILAAAAVPLLRGAAEHGHVLGLATAFTASSALVAAASPVRRARVVVVGRPREVRNVLAELGTTDRHDVVAVCLTRRASTTPWAVPSYVGLDSVTRAVTEHAARAVVVIPGRHATPPELRRLQWELAGTGAALYLGTGLLDVSPGRARVISTSGLDVLHVAPAQLNGPRRAVKDVLERLAALIGLTLLAPVMLALAVLVRLDTPGPALFRQERVGRDGKHFEMLKFRSMMVAAESELELLLVENEADGVLFKIKQDPRVSPVGRWMRRYSLDELPQLWNVVRGDMSLVGPRPALPREVALYDTDTRRRLVVKPGVTGLWQVSGRSNLTWEQSVRLDLRYVDNWTLRHDFAILFRTVRAVLGHQGAY